MSIILVVYLIQVGLILLFFILYCDDFFENKILIRLNEIRSFIVGYSMYLKKCSPQFTYEILNNYTIYYIFEYIQINMKIFTHCI